jgi:hypothetical protein
MENNNDDIPEMDPESLEQTNTETLIYFAFVSTTMMFLFVIFGLFLAAFSFIVKHF